MRYPDGGGLTAQGRSRRERVRLRAAEMFAHDADARQVAWQPRVSTKSACQWRRAWRVGGEAALASKGPGGNPRKLEFLGGAACAALAALLCPCWARLSPAWPTASAAVAPAELELTVAP